MKHGCCGLGGDGGRAGEENPRCCCCHFDDGDEKRCCVNITYHEMWQRVCLVCTELQRIGAEKETIGVCVEPGINLPSVLLGIWKASSSYYPFGQDGAGFVKQSLEKLGVRHLLLDVDSFQGLEHMLLKHESRVVASANLLSLGLCLVHIRPMSDSSRHRQHASDLCYCITTSGTTGTPKVVRVPHSCIAPNIVDFRREFQLTVGDITFLTSPLTFDPSVVDICMTLTSGASLLLVGTVVKMSPDRLLGMLTTRHSVSILQITPTAFQRFDPECVRRTLLGIDSSLRVLAFGGESFPPSSQFDACLHPGNGTLIYNVYGITELSCWATLHCARSPKGKVQEAVPIGEALTGTKVKVVDDLGEELMSGAGHILIGGSNRMCLLNEEDNQLPCGEAGTIWRRTGDLGNVDDKGNIFYLGRGDRQVKRNGKRLDLETLEKVCRDVDGVDQCRAVYSQTKLLLFVKGRSAEQKERVLARVKAHLWETLPSQYQPDVVAMVSDFPVNAHGKLDVVKLLKLHLDDTTKDESSVSMETWVLELWQGAVGQAKQKPLLTDRFLTSGGDSLRAVQLLDKIEERMGQPVADLLDVLLTGSLADLMALLQQQPSPQHEATPPEEPRRLKRSLVSDRPGERMKETDSDKVTDLMSLVQQQHAPQHEATPPEEPRRLERSLVSDRPGERMKETDSDKVTDLMSLLQQQHTPQHNATTPEDPRRLKRSLVSDRPGERMKETDSDKVTDLMSLVQQQHTPQHEATTSEEPRRLERSLVSDRPGERIKETDSDKVTDLMALLQQQHTPQHEATPPEEPRRLKRSLVSDRPGERMKETDSDKVTDLMSLVQQQHTPQLEATTSEDPRRLKRSLVSDRPGERMKETDSDKVTPQHEATTPEDPRLKRSLFSDRPGERIKETDSDKVTDLMSLLQQQHTPQHEATTSEEPRRLKRSLVSGRPGETSVILLERMKETDSGKVKRSKKEDSICELMETVTPLPCFLQKDAMLPGAQAEKRKLSSVSGFCEQTEVEKPNMKVRKVGTEESYFTKDDCFHSSVARANSYLFTSQDVKLCQQCQLHKGPRWQKDNQCASICATKSSEIKFCRCCESHRNEICQGDNLFLPSSAADNSRLSVALCCLSHSGCCSRCGKHCSAAHDQCKRTPSNIPCLCSTSQSSAISTTTSTTVIDCSETDPCHCSRCDKNCSAIQDGKLTPSNVTCLCSQAGSQSSASITTARDCSETDSGHCSRCDKNCSATQDGKLTPSNVTCLCSQAGSQPPTISTTEQSQPTVADSSQCRRGDKNCCSVGGGDSLSAGDGRPRPKKAACLRSSPEVKASLEGDTCKLELQWTVSTGKCVDASPLVATSRYGRSVVFIGSHSHKLLAVDLESGGTVWTTELGDRVEGSACLSPCGHHVVVGCYDKMIHILSAQTGEKQWRVETGDVVKCSPVADRSSQLVFCGSHDGFLYAVQCQTGSVGWKSWAGGGAVFASPVVSADSCMVIAVTLGGHITAASVKTGTVLWSVSLGKPIFSSPAAHSERLYVGCVDRALYCLSCDKGKKVWVFKTEAPIFSSPVLTTSLDISQPQILFGCHDNHVYCVSDSGQLVWRVEMESTVYASPFVFSLCDGKIPQSAPSLRLLKPQCRCENGDRTELNHGVDCRPSSKGFIQRKIQETEKHKGKIELKECIDDVAARPSCSHQIIHDSGKQKEKLKLRRLTDGCDGSPDCRCQKQDTEENICGMGEDLRSGPAHDCHCQHGYKLGLAIQAAKDKSESCEATGSSRSRSNQRPHLTTQKVVACASTKGIVSLLSGATGRKIGSVALLGDVFSSPVVFGDRLVVGCRDDSMYCYKLSVENAGPRCNP